MELKGGKKNGHCCGLFCRCGKMTHGHFFVKLFLALVIIAFVLVLALTVVFDCGKATRKAGKTQAFAMHVQDGGAQNYFFNKQVGGAVGMAVGVGSDGDFKMKMREILSSVTYARLFGTIVKIEANQITIKDNGAEERLVISQGQTIIVSSSTEVGLSALQVGQNIIVYGPLNESGALEAEMINIQK